MKSEVIQLDRKSGSHLTYRDLNTIDNKNSMFRRKIHIYIYIYILYKRERYLHFGYEHFPFFGLISDHLQSPALSGVQ